MAIEAIVLDLDGVIRHYDPAHPTEVEGRHGLAPGSLVATAFASERIGPLVTGRMSPTRWIDSVGRAVGNLDAAAEWLARPARTDERVLAIVDRLRASGHRVSILTNGTDTVPAELERAGILHRFDVLFNTAEIGVAKPDPAVFGHLCRSLDVEPGSVFFTDDSTNHVESADRFGLVARRFRGPARFEADLDEVL